MTKLLSLIVLLIILINGMLLCGCVAPNNPPPSDEWHSFKIEMDNGVSKETAETIKNIISSRFSDMDGFYDITLIPADLDNYRYLEIKYAKIDTKSATQLATSPGSFQIRIDTNNSQSELVLTNNDIVSNSVNISWYPLDSGNKESPNDNNEEYFNWAVDLQLTETGAKKFQKMSDELGVTTDPERHMISCLIDDQNIFSAPLSPDLAKMLKTDPVYSMSMWMGSGVGAKNRAKIAAQLIKYGPLPVELKII